MITPKSCVRRISAAMEDIRSYISLDDYDGAAEYWNNILLEANYLTLRPEIKNLPCGFLFTMVVDGMNEKLEKGPEGNIQPDYDLLRLSAGRTQEGTRQRRNFTE